LLGVESDQQRQARVQEEKDEKVRREKLDNERLRMQLAKIEADNKEAEARTTAASRAQSPQLFQSSQSVTDFAPVANRAVVYIWRKEMLPNPGGVSLSFNGTYAAKLKSGQYIRAELYEGVYNILGDVREMSVGAGVRRNDSISINVKAGQVYYIHLIGHINVNTWPEFRIQSDAEGRKAVKKSKLISQLFTN
ncbi:MAG: hypothetical protein LBB40_00040, partial [Holophagales bacterium]|jgi:hypothetical protein|nr:hypothetical protein [Holophagales bacterium]